MRRALIAALLLVGLVLGGCALTRHGVLRSLDGPGAMDVTVTVESDSARIHGTDPATGETFDGRLAREEGTEDVARTGVPAGGPPAGAEPVPGAAVRSTTLNLSGVLVGDLGTRLRCSIQVERRVLIRGSGLCRNEGEGAAPRRYRLTF